MNASPNPPLLELGPHKFRWGGLLALAGFVLLLFAVLNRLLEFTLIVLVVLVLLLVAAFVLLVLVGLGELAVDAWRGRQRRLEVMRASPLPHSETIRGGPPRSESDRVMASIVRDHVQTVEQRDPASLTDRDIARLRGQFPTIFRRPEHEAELNASVVGPAYELLLQGSPALEQQLRRYGEVQRHRPLWLLRRTVHVATGGRVGLSAEQVWQTPPIARIKADLPEFTRWFYSYGWPLLGRIGEALEARASSVVGSVKEEADRPSNEARRMLPEAGRTSEGSFVVYRAGERCHGDGAHEDSVRAAGPQSSRNPGAALDIVWAAVEAMQAQEPWDDPPRRIDALEDAALQAVALDDQSREARALLDYVRVMKGRLPEFVECFGEWMNGDPADWPAVVNAAYVACAAEATPANFEGHLARLFLTRGETESARTGTPMAGRFEEEPVASDTPRPPEDEPDLPMPNAPGEGRLKAQAHLTLIESPEPTAAQRAETLF